MLEQFANDPTARLVVFILLGFGLASMFHGTCKDQRCVMIQAPDPKTVEGKTFAYDGKCYKFQANMVSCPGSFS
jgi:hypothetical protein